MSSNNPIFGIAVRLPLSLRDVENSSYALFFNETLPASKQGGQYPGMTIFPTSLKIQKNYRETLNKILFFTPEPSPVFYEGDISDVFDNNDWKAIKNTWRRMKNAWRVCNSLQRRVRNLQDIGDDLQRRNITVGELIEDARKNLQRTDGAGPDIESVRRANDAMLGITHDLQTRCTALRKESEELQKKVNALQRVCGGADNDLWRTSDANRDIDSALRHMSDAKLDVDSAWRRTGDARRDVESRNLNDAFKRIGDAKRDIDSALQHISAARLDIDKKKTDLHLDIYQRQKEADMSAIIKSEKPGNNWIIIENLKEVSAGEIQDYYVFGTNYPLAYKLMEPAFPRTYYSDTENASRQKDTKNPKYLYCPYCGKRILSADFLYCPYCGSSLHIK